MRGQKTTATARDTTQAVANKDKLQSQIYSKTDCLSRVIDELLASLLIGLQYPHLNLPERVTVLDTIDGLLRLKIDLRRGEGVRCG